MEEHSPKLESRLSAQTCFLITNILQGVIQHGTGYYAKRLGRPLAGKTGTTERYVREWLSAQAAIGYVTYDAATKKFTLPGIKAGLSSTASAIACSSGSVNIFVAAS